VNWFRKDASGHFLWPGFGENSRVLAWIVQRTAGVADATATPIGNVPSPQALDTDELGLSESDVAELLKVDGEEWRREAPLIREFYERFADRLPVELGEQLDALEHRLH